VAEYDAVLLTSFGGPEGQDDVIPFLRSVTAGRGVPDERLEEVAHHYRAFGGVSPINAQNRALQAALQAEMASRGIDLPVYWGNRNWQPYLTDVVRDAAASGHTTLLGLVTSAYTSYSGVDQYREDYLRATAGTGVTVDRVREFFDHPGFVTPFIDGVRAAVESLATNGVAADRIHILYVTHSIPTAAADASGPEFGPGGAYVAQHEAVASVIHTAAPPVAGRSLVYQSRSGDPYTPWLEPDINDTIRDLAATRAADAVIVVPIGFVSDHMEVVWDLDHEAAATAAEVHLGFRRVLTPGVHPDFVRGLVDLLVERLRDVPPAQRPHLTALGPWPDHARITNGVVVDGADTSRGVVDDAEASLPGVLA